MIFWELFITFAKIGIVNFGGGYAMLSLIQSEVVYNHQWISSKEFTDIVAMSQMTPGPVGINAATYVGYTATINAGYSEFWAIIASLLSSFAVLLLPFLLMLMLSSILIKYKDKAIIKNIFRFLRPIIIGLIASAALLLMNKENFSNYDSNLYQFIISIFIFIASFIAVYRYKVNIFYVLGLAALLGIIVY